MHGLKEDIYKELLPSVARKTNLSVVDCGSYSYYLGSDYKCQE